jgi:hypothetical protein
MPKYLTKAEMLFLCVFAISFQQTVDLYLDVKLDLYGYFKKGVDWEYLLLFPILFPGLLCISINFFPYKKSLKQKIFYIIGWTAVSTMYEAISVKSDYFYYNGWKLWWSIPMYPVLFTINAYVFYLFRKWNKNRNE